MKWTRRIGLWLMALAVLVGCVGCGQSPELHLVTLKGPTAMGAVYTKAAETMTVAAAPEEVLGQVTSGEADVAMVPVNMAALLNRKLEGGVRLLAVTTVGNLYLVGEKPLATMDDLEGKTIISAGQGATPMMLLDALTVEVDVLDVEYLPTHSDVVAAASEKRGDYYLLPEPFVSVYLAKVEGGTVAYDLAAAYRQLTGHELTMGCLITTTAKLEEKREAIDHFLDEYRDSVDQVVKDPAAAATRIVERGILEDEALAAKAVPGSGLVYLPAQEAKEDVQAFLAFLMEQNPKAVGGELPGDEFYEGSR